MLAPMILVDFVEVLQGVCWVGFDGRSLRLPVSGAHLSMFLNKLESFDKTECLIYTATNWKIINGHLSQNTLKFNMETMNEKNLHLIHGVPQKNPPMLLRWSITHEENMTHLKCNVRFSNLKFHSAPTAISLVITCTSQQHATRVFMSSKTNLTATLQKVI